MIHHMTRFFVQGHISVAPSPLFITHACVTRFSFPIVSQFVASLCLSLHSAIQCWCQLQRPDSPSPACVTDLLQRVVQHEDSVIQAMVKALEKPPPSVSDVSDCMEDLGVDQGDAGCRGEGCQAADCCKRGGDIDIDLKPSQKPSCSGTTDFLSSEENFERLVQSCMEVVSELRLPKELAQHLKQLNSAD